MSKYTPQSLFFLGSPQNPSIADQPRIRIVNSPCVFLKRLADRSKYVPKVCTPLILLKSLARQEHLPSLQCVLLGSPHKPSVACPTTLLIVNSSWVLLKILA